MSFSLGAGPRFMAWRQQVAGGPSDASLVGAGIAALVADARENKSSAPSAEAWEQQVALWAASLTNRWFPPSAWREGPVPRFQVVFWGPVEGCRMTWARTAARRMPPLPLPGTPGAMPTQDGHSEGSVHGRSRARAVFGNPVAIGSMEPQGHVMLAERMRQMLGVDNTELAALMGAAVLLTWEAVAATGAVTMGHVFRDLREVGQPEGSGDVVRLTLERFGQPIWAEKARASDPGVLLVGQPQGLP